MKAKEIQGIKGIKSFRSKVFLLDYTNHVLAEASDLIKLQLEVETPKVIKALEFIGLNKNQAKLVWLTNDTVFILDPVKELFKDMIFLKDHTGEKIMAMGDYHYFNNLIKKQEELRGTKHKILQTSSSTYLV